MAFPSLISALKKPYRNWRSRFSGRHSGIIMTGMIGSVSGSVAEAGDGDGAGDGAGSG